MPFNFNAFFLNRLHQAKPKGAVWEKLRRSSTSNNLFGMHLARTPFLPASPILKNRNRIITLCLIGISTYFGFQLFDSMHSYMPWQTRIPLALRKTFMIHFGLWLATIGIRNRFRFLVAALMIPSGAGAYLLCWPVGIITAIPAAFGLGWLTLKTIRGESLDP